MENGARNVYPVASLEEADEIRAKLDAARIEGYDRGPFPEEPRRSRVSDASRRGTG